MPAHMPVIDRDLNERPYRPVLVKVTNNNDFDISDMYDGVAYVFARGEETKMPAEAAHHIFGWTETASEREVFLHVQKRWGWNTPDRSDKALRWFNNLKISHAVYKLVEVADDENPSPEDETTIQQATGARGARRA
jgi:hypothetical protein